MTDEYFYGITLTTEKDTHTWDPYANIDDGDAVVPNKLLIKQVLLDVTAKEGEYHVIEVTAPTCMDEVTVPLAVLKVGENRSVSMELDFPDAPVTFKLVKGSSPVHILGHHLIGEAGGSGDEMWGGDFSSGEEEEAEDEDEAARRKKKVANSLKPAVGGGGGGKMAPPPKPKKK